MKSNRREFIKVTGLAGAGIMLGCSTKKPEKTFANLKVAYIREATTTEKYSKFAEKAAADSYNKFAIMLRAISKAESIHGANHKKVMDKLGDKFEGSPIGNYEVKTTLENLEDGYKSESFEVQTLYPSFIEVAKAENVPEAIETFTWADQVEIQHQGYYNVAITALGNKSELTLPEKWYVCPKCGGTYAIADLKSTCFFDPTPKEQFFEFK
jgi:rubrerythrin